MYLLTRRDVVFVSETPIIHISNQWDCAQAWNRTRAGTVGKHACMAEPALRWLGFLQAELYDFPPSLLTFASFHATHRSISVHAEVFINSFYATAHLNDSGPSKERADPSYPAVTIQRQRRRHGHRSEGGQRQGRHGTVCSAQVLWSYLLFQSSRTIEHIYAWTTLLLPLISAII